jgi:hypothetical protein
METQSKLLNDDQLEVNVIENFLFDDLEMENYRMSLRTNQVDELEPNLSVLE